MVRRKRPEDHVIDRIDVLRVSRYGDPAKWPYSLTEQRTDIKVDKRTHPESVLDAGRLCLRAQAVAIFEHDGAAIEKLQHRTQVNADRAPRQRNQFFRIAPAHRACFFER